MSRELLDLIEDVACVALILLLAAVLGVVVLTSIALTLAAVFLLLWGWMILLFWMFSTGPLEYGTALAALCFFLLLHLLYGKK